MVMIGSLPHRQLRKILLPPKQAAVGSLPHRQLRNNTATTTIQSSLPHRQLRNNTDKSV